MRSYAVEMNGASFLAACLPVGLWPYLAFGRVFRVKRVPVQGGDLEGAICFGYFFKVLFVIGGCPVTCELILFLVRLLDVG